MAIKSKRRPWSYRKGSTLLHRMPAGLKLCFLLLLSLASFFPNLFVLSAILLILIILSLTAAILPWELLRGSRPLFFLILGVFLLQSFEISPEKTIPFGINLDGLLESLVYCARIAAAFAAGALLFSVTTSTEIRRSLSRLEHALRLEKLNISLSISLMLSFMPRFFEVWENLDLAYKSRGGKNRISRLRIILPLAIEKMMAHAAQAALAMEGRGKIC